MKKALAIIITVTLSAGTFAALDAGAAVANKSAEAMRQQHKAERKEREARRIASELCTAMASSGQYSNLTDTELATYCINVAMLLIHEDFEDEPGEGGEG